MKLALLFCIAATATVAKQAAVAKNADAASTGASAVHDRTYEAGDNYVEASHVATHTPQPEPCAEVCPAEAPCRDKTTGACQPKACAHYAMQWAPAYAEPAKVDGYGRKLQSGFDESVRTYSEASRYEPPRMHCGCPPNTEDSSGDSLAKNKHWPLWTAFGLLVVPAVYFMWKGFEDLRESAANDNFVEGAGTERIVAGFICGIASIAYLAMSLGHGYIVRCCDGRSFYYARYVDWALTTPLQIWELSRFAGAADLDRLFLTVIDFLMIIAGLIGALICDSEKWAFWGFGILCFLPILWFLCSWDKKLDSSASDADKRRASYYRQIMNITVITWIVYPIIWIVSEGTGKISVYGETIAYTILDIISKSVFGWIIVHTSFEEANRGYSNTHSSGSGNRNTGNKNNKRGNTGNKNTGNRKTGNTNQNQKNQNTNNRNQQSQNQNTNNKNAKKTKNRK